VLVMAVGVVALALVSEVEPAVVQPPSSPIPLEISARAGVVASPSGPQVARASARSAI
jgi:hypothetical protein